MRAVRIDRGKIHVTEVDEVVPLESAAEGFSLVAEGATAVKVVLEP